MLAADISYLLKSLAEANHTTSNQGQDLKNLYISFKMTCYNRWEIFKLFVQDVSHLSLNQKFCS